MALLFLDSFEHYAANQASRKWNFGSGISVISPAKGRTGNGAEIGTFSNPNKTILPEFQTFCLGCAFRYNVMGGIIQCYGTWGPNPTIKIGVHDDGRVTVGTDVGDAPPFSFVVSIGVWVYLELWGSITVVTDDSTHYHIHYDLAAHANEAPIGTWSTDSPVYGGSGFTGRGFSVLNAIGAGGSFQTSIDDVYLTDGEFLGDIKIGCLYPNAPGDASDWTPTAAPNWSNVEEHPPDDDTTTVTASTVGQKDLYNLDDLPTGFTAQIKGVQAGWCLKKTDAGGAAVTGVWKSGTTEITQTHGGLNVIAGNYYPSYASYTYNLQPERKSIFTSADWTLAEINSLQLGMKRTI